MREGDAPLPPGARQAPVVVRRHGQVHETTDWLADEVPVALVMNGISQAVMLASPLDLEDFALGFGLTEAFLAHAGELYGIDVTPGESGITIEMEIASAAFMRLKERRRNLAGRTGCGLCGTERLEQVALSLPPLVDPPTVGAEAIVQAMAALPKAQTLQHSTGAVHAAAWCSLGGEIRLVREDVGRHNALDKLVGAMTRARADARDGFVCITSRASFEMVQKTVIAGVGTLAAVSAPTDFARRTALTAGLALAGFVRGADLVLYSHAERFKL
jgi:FdhD protein